MSQTDATEALARGPFYLERTEDVSGTSGTGRVAQGFVFDDGTVALRWLTEHTSTAIYASLSEVEMIHGHDGKTAVVAIEQAAEAAEAAAQERERIRAEVMLLPYFDRRAVPGGLSVNRRAVLAILAEPSE